MKKQARKEICAMAHAAAEAARQERSFLEGNDRRAVALVRRRDGKAVAAAVAKELADVS